MFGAISWALIGTIWYSITIAINLRKAAATFTWNVFVGIPRAIIYTIMPPVSITISLLSPFAVSGCVA
jgi:hypothetical protein